LITAFTHEEVSEYITKKSSLFQADFSQKFPAITKNHSNICQSALSGLLGGIGYFAGDAIHMLPPPEEDPFEDDEGLTSSIEKHERPFLILQSSTPSRSAFPRGFLWDEGFHLVLINSWNHDIAMDILGSWLDLMNADGWIPREIILGNEARARVPSEFQVQNPEIANPPTLFLLISTLTTSEKATFFPRLLTWFNWFRSSQRGVVPPGAKVANEEVYRWRGKQGIHCLASGLDDYPRAPTSDSELHVDLMTWIVYMAQQMVNVAPEEEKEKLLKIYKDAKSNLMELHYNSTRGVFSDISAAGNSIHEEYHIGYLNILPLLLGVLDPSHPSVGTTLRFMSDPDHLYSEFGLRSLSKSDKLYGQHENYWRGPIWVNMNYLALKSLHQVCNCHSHYKCFSANYLYTGLQSRRLQR